jgi:sulfite reductase (NADPH) flavoprotein alpha-component
MPLTIPDNAPFTGAQRMWLKGFLDGVNQGFGSGTASGSSTISPVAAASGGSPVTILWGSQTGNSEALSKKLAKTLKANGHLPTIKDMAAVSPAELSGIEMLLIITSTYGDGEPPDNAASLHSALHADDAPSMASVKFSVLALGDSNYASFCKCGHDFDQRLSALGASRLALLVECDVEFDEAFAAWSSKIATAITGSRVVS